MEKHLIALEAACVMIISALSSPFLLLCLLVVAYVGISKVYKMFWEKHPRLAPSRVRCLAREGYENSQWFWCIFI